MKFLIQRVESASVSVDSVIISEIDKGLLILVGFEKDDTIENLEYLVNKSLNLRIFESIRGKLDHSVKDINGQILFVSQFTLCADCTKGRKPDFGNAAKPEYAKELYKKGLNAFKKNGIVVKPGKYQNHMKVRLINDGPVTIMLESNKHYE